MTLAQRLARVAMVRLRATGAAVAFGLAPGRGLWLTSGCIAASSVVLAGCPREAQTPRHMAHGAVLAVAHAVKLSAGLCIDRASAMHDAGDLAGAEALWSRCKRGYDAAKPAVLAAAYAVDAWGSAEAGGKASCAIGEALSGLEQIVAAAEGAGVVMPREVADGVFAAKWLVQLVPGAACPVKGAK